MAYIFGYVYISLSIVLTIIKSLIAFNKIKRSGQILFDTRIVPLTLTELFFTLYYNKCVCTIKTINIKVWNTL